MFSSAVLAVTCSLGTVRAQQAGVATPSLQQQLEAIDASLYKQPKSIDLLCVKAELLARQGSMAELRRCREQMMALFREQDDRIAQWLLDGRAERSEGER